MRNPSIDTLLEIIDSKYTLALTVARRAKSIDKGSPMLITKIKSKKPVGIALEEIVANKLKPGPLNKSVQTELSKS
jgi:DNA-directed RNA polymerase subunit omega